MEAQRIEQQKKEQRLEKLEEKLEKGQATQEEEEEAEKLKEEAKKFVQRLPNTVGAAFRYAIFNVKGNDGTSIGTTMGYEREFDAFRFGLLVPYDHSNSKSLDVTLNRVVGVWYFLHMLPLALPDVGPVDLTYGGNFTVGYSDFQQKRLDDFLTVAGGGTASVQKTIPRYGDFPGATATLGMSYVFSKDYSDAERTVGQNFRWGLNFGIPLLDSLAVNIFEGMPNLVEN